MLGTALMVDSSLTNGLNSWSNDPFSKLEVGARF